MQLITGIRVLVYQFMRFEFNQRTRLTGGTRKFWDIRCKNFSEAQVVFIHVTRRTCVLYVPGAHGRFMRVRGVRGRCRLQLLELGAGSCTIRFRRHSPRSVSRPRVRKCILEKAPFSTQESQQHRTNTVENSFENRKLSIILYYKAQEYNYRHTKITFFF